MLHEFLTANRAELIEQCRSRVAERQSPETSGAEAKYGVPLFLDQLIEMLRVEQASRPESVRETFAAANGGAGSEMGMSATLHGRELMQRGYTVEQVVRDYGDLCQAITGLAFQLGTPIEVDEFRTLNRCLDDGIADSVTEFAYQHDFVKANSGAQELNERLGFLAHEMRNFLNTTTLAIAVIKAGGAGFGGATGALLDRSLVGMRNLIDRSLADVRLTAGMPARYELFSVSDFISETKISASLEAAVHECTLTVATVDPVLAVDADRDMLSSALGNLLKNAFKFTAHNTEVKLSAYAEADRIRISVEDCCGGLPPGDAEKLFQPFTQSGEDKSGVGLGLAICRRGTEINNGVLSVNNIPGKGCVFTIDLPRHAVPAPG
jgi:signal transduction histidine kinase